MDRTLIEETNFMLHIVIHAELVFHFCQNRANTHPLTAQNLWPVISKISGDYILLFLEMLNPLVYL
jgi:hypothetical protein